MANNQVSTVTNKTAKMGKVTLGKVFEEKGLEVLTYINKKTLTDNDVVFCILKAEKVEVPNSKFDIKEQWILTIALQASDETIRRYWLSFMPNETRDDFMQAVQEALQEAHKQDMQAVHSCKLQAVPLAEYDNPYYALINTEEECNCKLDA